MSNVLAGEKEVQLDKSNEDFEFDRDGTCSMLIGKIDDKILKFIAGCRQQ